MVVLFRLGLSAGKSCGFVDLHVRTDLGSVAGPGGARGQHEHQCEDPEDEERRSFSCSFSPAGRRLAIRRTKESSIMKLAREWSQTRHLDLPPTSHSYISRGAVPQGGTFRTRKLCPAPRRRKARTPAPSASI